MNDNIVLFDTKKRNKRDIFFEAKLKIPETT